MKRTSQSTDRQPTLDALDALQPGLGSMQGMSDLPAAMAHRIAQLDALRAEVADLRGERDRLLNHRHEIAELLKSANPDKIMHALRNVLNELQLLKMLSETPE